MSALEDNGKTTGKSFGGASLCLESLELDVDRCSFTTLDYLTQLQLQHEAVTLRGTWGQTYKPQTFNSLLSTSSSGSC